MSLYVLVDATGSYWWLRKGGFGILNNGHQPMTFASETQAIQKAANLRCDYGFDCHPEPLRSPVSKRAR